MKGWMRIGVRASFICCRYAHTQPVRSNVSLRFGSCARSRVAGVINLGFQTRVLSRTEACQHKMVNAIKGLFISCDIPMAQFIVNLNASLPASQKFIVHMLDNTHMFVQPHVAEMIRSRIGEFRDQNTYEKPA